MAERKPKTEMKYRDSLLRKARKPDKEIDWSAYKRKRNSVNNLLKSAKNNYYDELFEENVSSPEKFWKCIKQLFPTKNENGNTCSSMVIDGEKVLDKQVIANGFSYHFFTTAAILKEKLSLLKSTVWAQPVPDKYNTNSVFKFAHVSVPTVMKHLKSLNRKKATGLDDIPPCLLKDGATHIAKPLAHVINRSLATGIVPTEFKCGKIVPIYKSGNQTDIDNYRPITILPTISKVLEKCVYSQTIFYLEQNKLLLNQQFGFRKNHSTELAATLFLDNIRKEMDLGKLCGAVFVDLRKAFDTISHSSIVCKLFEYGITDVEKEWFTNYLFGRTQCVVFGGCTSDVNPVFCGVPQGSILGPLLFLIQFNGVCLHVKNCKILMYADDIVLYYAHKDVKTIEQKLTEDMSHLSEWFEKNELIVKLQRGKTECMLFCTGRNLSKIKEHELNIMYNNTLVNYTTSYTYLGVLLDQTLNLAEHFNKIYKRSHGRLKLLLKIRKSMTMRAAATV